MRHREVLHAALRNLLAMMPRQGRAKVASYLKQRENFSTLARRYGQFATMRDWSSVDATGAPIPWYTYPAIEYLSHLEFTHMRVFEFGSGNSSLWWLQRCHTLTSIEDNAEWFERIQLKAASNPGFSYVFEPDKDRYPLTLVADDFDIVIIDGKHRPECAERFLAVRRRSPDGAMMIVFDNADWYPETIRRLRHELRWLQVDFHGFGPINDYTWTTTMFLDPSQVGRIPYRTDLRSVAAVAQPGSQCSSDGSVGATSQ